MVSSPSAPQNKLIYIDHLRVVLTVLVILHHAFITYGAPGGWYYTQKTSLAAALKPMTLFVAVNQSFFMGFFFFLSALFIPASYNKKGAAKFTADRLLRLGVPLLFYSFILSPFLSYMPYNFAEGHHITYLQYLSGFDGWINFGVLWFVLALLLFTLLYVLFRQISGTNTKVWSAPSIPGILLVAVGVGVVAYFVRIYFPVGWVLKPFGFQPAHFPQYIALFILGLAAANNKWLDGITYQMGKRMLWVVAGLILIGFPLFIVVRTLLDFPVEDFNIGGRWPSLWYAVWEQLTGFSIITALLCIGKYRWNRPSAAWSKLARTTFAVYIFHPLLLIGLSVAVSGWQIEPLYKLLLVAPLAVIFSFLLGAAVVKIPGVQKII